jgi:hypothetical protein
MLDETEEAPSGEADDAIDVGDDGAVDLADLGGEAETADEPAVTAEELMDIPDAPESFPTPPDVEDAPVSEAADAPASEAAELGAQAAAEDAEGAGGDRVEGADDA